MTFSTVTKPFAGMAASGQTWKFSDPKGLSAPLCLSSHLLSFCQMPTPFSDEPRDGSPILRHMRSRRAPVFPVCYPGRETVAELPRQQHECSMSWNLGREATFPLGNPGALMQDFGLNKVVLAGVVALMISGSTLVIAAPAVAADLAPYVTDEEAVLERPPIRPWIMVEEKYSAPSIEHRVIERRVVERRIVEGYEGPALVPPRSLPIVPVEESEGYEGPALVPPQYMPVAPEECRVVVVKRIDVFGEVTVRRAHACG